MKIQRQKLKNCKEPSIEDNLNNDWNGFERRRTCQGCSSVYSRLLKVEKLNSSSHNELFERINLKISKREFIISVMIISFLFILSFKFRNDFEIRYINGLEAANKKMQTVIFSLKDLINSIDVINQKIVFNEEDLNNKIERLQDNVYKTQDMLNDLRRQANKGEEKNEK